ncbi:MAG: SAM-dependent methyltransferase [Nocardiopsaceae bacterium]|nr:SAM-dependent methyltransferase [Nocardiopsaceae bacterium]
MADFDPRKPSIARIYDYGLGGKDNFAADRETVRELLKLTDPDAPVIAVENRELLTAAVRWAADHGIDQFIDLGSGLPAEPSVQRTARQVRAGARIASVDNDPVVINHLSTLAKDELALAVDRDVADVDPERRPLRRAVHREGAAVLHTPEGGVHLLLRRPGTGAAGRDRRAGLAARV